MNQQKKFYLIIVIFTILNITLIVFIFLLYFHGIVKKSQDFLTKKQEIQLTAKMKKETEQMEESLKAWQADLDKIENLFLIPSKIPLEFVEFLEKNAFDSNLRIKIISITQEKEIKEKNIWPYFAFKISIDSPSFINLLTFINKLETTPSYLIEITKLDIKKILSLKEKKEKETADIYTTLLIKVFTKK